MKKQLFCFLGWKGGLLKGQPTFIYEADETFKKRYMIIIYQQNLSLEGKSYHNSDEGMRVV